MRITADEHDESLGRILVVDDEPLNRDLVQQELEDRGYDVELASNGREALDRIASAAPDLVLLDVVMPVLDGFQTCRAIKGDPATALIPVVMMTALTAVDDRVEGIRAGADDFLSKPVDDRELMARIETALRTKRAVDRTRRELSSATHHLAAVGRVDRDVTAVVVQGPADQLELAATELVNEAAQRIDGDDHTATWIYVDPDPAAHVRTAAAAAARASRIADVAIALESGSALVQPVRIEDDAGPRWSTQAAGVAVSTAREAASHAAPGQVVAGSEACDRLESTIGLDPIVGTPLCSLDLDDLAEPVAAGDGGLTFRWPADYDDLLEPLRAAWGVDDAIYLMRALGGKSGARVYAVDITTTDFSGQSILKLDQAPQPDWDEQIEADRHVQAAGANVRYAREHFARVVHTLVRGDAVATLSTIAGGGLEYVLPWAHADYPRQLRSGTEISAGVLRDWNDGYELSPVVAPGEVLHRWLDYRLDPERGRIFGFLVDHGVPASSPSFHLDGRWYPNPYAFAVDPAVAAVPPLRAVTGHLHGDLHGFNVLVRNDGADDRYHVIDLAMYEPDRPLMFDNAYFELSHLLHTRGTTPIRRWVELVGAAEGGPIGSADDSGLLDIVRSVRAGVHEWIDAAEPNRLAFMESQHTLARVAVGLNFVHKRVAEHYKLLALVYAAIALRRYLDLHGVDWPRHGPDLDDRTAAHHDGRTPAA